MRNFRFNWLAILALCGAFLVPSVGLADSKFHETLQDREEMREDMRQIFDDSLDVARLKAQLAEFERHCEADNRAGLAEVDMRVRHILEAEIAEGELELAQDETEIARSQAEVRMAKINRRYHLGHGMLDVAADYARDMREDRADLTYDYRDFVQEYTTLSRRKVIQTAMKDLYGQYGPVDLAQKRALIQELIGMAEVEARESRSELLEDRLELWEDQADLL